VKRHHFPPVGKITPRTDLTRLEAVRAAVNLAAKRCAGDLDGALSVADLRQEAWLWLHTLAGRARVRHAMMPDGTIYVRQLAADIYQRRLRTIVERDKTRRSKELPLVTDME
jgi:hypothetical protein